ELVCPSRPARSGSGPFPRPRRTRQQRRVYQSRRRPVRSRPRKGANACGNAAPAETPLLARRQRGVFPDARQQRLLLGVSRGIRPRAVVLRLPRAELALELAQLRGGQVLDRGQQLFRSASRTGRNGSHVRPLLLRLDSSRVPVAAQSVFPVAILTPPDEEGL